MCVCSMFRSSFFFTILQKRIRGGSTYAECNSGSLKYPHCASATRRLALDNRTYSAQIANATHTRCRHTLSWMGARWPSGLERREVGEGGREGGREGGMAGGREGASVKEGRVKGEG